MSDFIVLNAYLLLFLFLTLLVNSLKPNLSQVKKVSIKIPPRLLFLLIILGFILVLALVLKGPKDYLAVYIQLSFSMLIVSHGLWLSLNRNLTSKVLAFLIALLLLTYRFIYPSYLSHNIFIIVSLLWLGPFFTQIELLTKKRFIIISLLWFSYDIIFVWLTPLFQQVASSTTEIGFPLALEIGETSLGTGDLVWANLFLSLIKSKKHLFWAIFILLSSNILLDIYASYIKDISSFPLLVLWVPLGLPLVLLTGKN